MKRLAQMYFNVNINVSCPNHGTMQAEKKKKTESIYSDFQLIMSSDVWQIKSISPARRSSGIINLVPKSHSKYATDETLNVRLDAAPRNIELQKGSRGKKQNKTGRGTSIDYVRESEWAGRQSAWKIMRDSGQWFPLQLSVGWVVSLRVLGICAALDALPALPLGPLFV